MTEPTLKMEALHVYKSFGEVKVLHDVSVKVHSGEVVALIGPSGAGKSTFLRCVNNLQPIDSGTIEVDGDLIGYRKVGDFLEPLGDKEAAAQRARIGMVFQNFNLFRHMTAVANVMYGQIEVLGRPKAEAQATAMDALKRVGLVGREDRYPSQLSGGQQQRVAIARVLAMNPTMILLDEPTSALDPELRVEVANVIKGMAANKATMLMATHDIPLVHDIADYIIFMVDGRIVEAGPAEKILTNPEHDRTRSFLTAMES
ncbi:MAG: amino acid ABC transporter ATP-binding protein [Micropruina sp.]|uniref:amino acid ABC transporter ATP-binding protein n=1 Tax=Micropruina sp. TaxID=2737536 RepID=UPI0039E5266B